MRVLVLVLGLLAAIPARADDGKPPAVAVEAKPLVGISVRGRTKVTDATMLRLAHVKLGDRISARQIRAVEAALISSELFKKVTVTLEDAPGGVVLVATVADKLPWIAAPTVYVLPDDWSAGLGYAENDLFGEDKKLLLYGQIGKRTSLFFGTYLDPSVMGTKLTWRWDVFLFRHAIDEYANPPSDPTSFDVLRTSTENLLDGGVLVGWTWRWWLIGDLRLRSGYAFFTDVQAPDPANRRTPEADGWDTTLEAKMTLDARHHRFGVTWGPYVQLQLESSLPLVDTYHYQSLLFRAYYSWRIFCEHQLEVRTLFDAGRHLPLHEEWSLGSAIDLRGYNLDQFRGDTKGVLRAEYSVPIAKWRSLAFRGIGFWDSGATGFYWRDPSGQRDYLPGQHDGAHWWRNDVGAGFRVYVSSIVLPLLGLDFGYGLEGKRHEIYFEVGLTDF